MQVTLNCDSFGRVIAAIAHNGAPVTVTSSEPESALADLQEAVAAAALGHGECFWHEVAGDYRWCFRRDGSAMRVAILWSAGTLTGWEHKFWAECDAGEFGRAMDAAIAGCATADRQL